MEKTIIVFIVCLLLSGIGAYVQDYIPDNKKYLIGFIFGTLLQCLVQTII